MRDDSTLVGIDGDTAEQARNTEREWEARRRVAEATNVDALCAALNAFERLQRKIDCDDLEAWPIFEEGYELDWSDFADEPVSVDAQHVLFKERVTGRYYYMTKADCEGDDAA